MPSLTEGDLPARRYHTFDEALRSTTFNRFDLKSTNQTLRVWVRMSATCRYNRYIEEGICH